MGIFERFKTKKEEPERGRTQEEREAYFKSEEFKRPHREAVERVIEREMKEHELTPERKIQFENRLTKIQEEIDKKMEEAKREREKADKYRLQAFGLQPHFKGVRPESFEGQELKSARRDIEMFSRQAEKREEAIEAKIEELQTERDKIKEQLGLKG